MGDTGGTEAPKKKRSRASRSPDDNSGDEGKKRGRPRVEKLDQSIADRRRTQIRMAQRAYRQRKESTLEDLRKRVSDLTNTIELMNKAFLDCRDRLATSGLADSQTQDMHETLEQYQNLMRCVRNPGEDMDHGIAPDLSQPSSSSAMAGKDAVRASAMEPKNVASWMDQTAVDSQAKTRISGAQCLGYTMYEPQGTKDINHAMVMLNKSDPQAVTSASPHHGTSNGPALSLGGFSLGPPDSFGVPATVTPPTTYSFNESTFAKRLHRACLEHAYQLLLDPQRRPATYGRVFKLSLMVKDRNKLILGIKALLSRPAHEDLDANATPIHVGGAGTHYPRRDANGTFRPKKDSWNLGLVGPKTLALLESAAGDNLTADMAVEVAGFEGEWFDPYDVEGYLMEKGIHINPACSFAQAEVVIKPSQSSVASSESTITGEAPKTPLDMTSSSDVPKPFDAEQLEFLNRGNVSPHKVDDWTAMNLSNVGYSDASTGSWMNFLQPSEASKQQQQTANLEAMSWQGSAEFLGGDVPGIGLGTLPQKPVGPKAQRQQQQQPNKKVILLDVNKFIKVLTISAVCIGRGPGFKRRDVDRALALASFDAF
ncbi:Hypothetical predicted protein [Lecanosticta acicola]|uniref:BZIP domain-containing protein n=1 Tax=Lecanosticta acicola TaxID=111012 RepID=A0AAI8YWB7_9PEZI|nr:Hypothetical predicted protein [Lecanosticta acicola]